MIDTDNDKNRYKIIISGLLKDNPQGLTIEALSSRTKINRVKTNNILSELKGEKKIYVRAVGMAKVHYWRFSKK